MTTVDLQGSLVVWIVVSLGCLEGVDFSFLFVLVIMVEGLSSFFNHNYTIRKICRRG